MRKIEAVLNSVLELPDDEIQGLDMEGLWALIRALSPSLHADFVERFHERNISFRLRHN